MSATTESKPRKLFTVEGGTGGITVKLSKTALDALEKAADVLNCLGKANGTFPGAATLSDDLDNFIENPTAKPTTGNT